MHIADIPLLCRIIVLAEGVLAGSQALEQASGALVSQYDVLHQPDRVLQGLVDGRIQPVTLAREEPTTYHMVRVRLSEGLHMRPATLLVKTMMAFEGSATLAIQRRPTDAPTPINARSIMALLMLAIPQGEEIWLIARGPRGEELLEKLEALNRNGWTAS